jgi:RDD family
VIPSNRKAFDNRRVLARVVDELVLLPIFVWSMPYDFGVSVFALALWLVYMFLCEATTGQTVGKALFKLRVVTVDGRIANDRAIAARTVLRLFEEPLIAVITLLATGERRQRLGDLAAGTVVVDARDVVVSKPLGLGVMGYPVAWLLPALVVLGFTVKGNFPGSYRVAADSICEEADAIVPSLQGPEQLAQLTAEEAAALSMLHAPPNWRHRHALLVAEYRGLSRKLGRVTERAQRSGAPQAVWKREWPRLQMLAEQSNARLAELGYKGCAGPDAA